MTAMRAGTALSAVGIVLGFALSWHLGDPTPFTVVGGAGVGMKFLENVAQRTHGERKAGEK